MRKPLTAGIQEVRDNLRARVDDALEYGQHTIIERKGRVVAYLVPPRWYERKTAGQPTEEVFEQAVRIVAYAAADYATINDPQYTLIDNINSYLRDPTSWNPDFPDDANEDY